MKKVLSIVLCIVMVCTLCASAFAAEKDTYVIGALMKQNADTFVKNISDAIEAHAEELGEVVSLDLQDAEGDINKQLEQAETMLAKGVDAVILNAVDVDGSAPIVDMCIEAGVPCIECNTLTNNVDDAACYVGSDDVDAGKIQAEFLLTVLPNDAKVCYMMGPIGVSSQIYRLDGITKYLFDVTDIEVLQSQTANWKRDEAMNLAENWLTQYQDLDAIICQNDDMAMGALEAAEAMDRKEGLVIVGIDAITDAVQAVADGRLDASVFQDAAGQGAGALDVALECAQKGLLKTEDVWIPFLPVTAENAADFM